jgi:hypothetical protein
MPSIKIEVVGCNARDIQIQLEQLCEAFGIGASGADFGELSLDDKVALTKAALMEQGMEMLVRAVVAPLPEAPRRGRKPKISEEEALVALGNDDLDNSQLEALKSATIKKLEKLYLDGEKGYVDALLRSMGTAPTASRTSRLNSFRR